MLSRIMWISVAGIALIAGIAMQDGDWIFGSNDRTEISSKADRTVEARVDRAIERSFDKMQVTDGDGREIDVPARTKRALADAVGLPVSFNESQLTMLIEGNALQPGRENALVSTFGVTPTPLTMGQ